MSIDFSVLLNHMIMLITLVMFGIIAAFFATQNTATASVTLLNYTIGDIPMYLIVLISVLIGLLLSSLITMVNSIAATLAIHGKDVKIKETKQTVTELAKRVRELELENEHLKTKKEDTA